MNLRFRVTAAFPPMSLHDDGWRLDEHHGSIPFLFSIKATK